MLIEFSVTNFKSIHSTQTLSLVASPATELEEQNCFKTSEKGVPRLLRSIAMYGPNASGKSNFLEAMDFMESFVTESSKEGQEGEPIEVKPFMFNSISRTEPSEFEVLFLQEGIRYQYGFAANSTRVTHEWLIAYPEGRSQRWFERVYDTAANKENWYFGSKFKGHKTVLQEATRSNALFLSTAVQFNNESLKPIYNWFHKKLRTIGVAGLAPSYSASLCKTDAGRKRILELLNAADLSIADLKVEMKKFDLTDLPSDMPEPLKEVISKELDGKEMPEVKFMHTMAGSEELVALDPDDESVGTRKLFTLAGPWLDVIDNGHVLFVDELNNSMHPKMVRFLIGLINNPQINRKNAQLIFSTHDTSVLDNELFRRDQIWFTEKDATNATKLYPLSDFTPRKGEALEKGYLNGRYGALPYIGEVRF
ncbi:MAG: ATP-binding protein [Proteobacteria bacterium]|nr:ATP-binding protein [Pseudomonadota bacterium]